MLVGSPCSESDIRFLPLIQHATINDTNETIKQNPDAPTLAMDKPPIVMMTFTMFNAADTFLPESVRSMTSWRAEV